MRTTYNISFYCRRCKTDRKGLAPIEISIIINSKRVFIQLQRKEYPDTFKKSLEAKRNNPIKEYLEEVRNQFNQIQLDMMRNNVPLTSDSLKEYFRTGGVKTYTIQDLFNEYFELLKKRVGINLTYPAFKKYEDAQRCFFKYVQPNKELITVTPSIIENFKADIDKIYKPSTVNGIMTKIKTVFMYGKDNGKLNINPFSTVKYSKIDNGIEYLTEEEIKALKTKEIPNNSLSKVRDVAVFMLSSGLSYTDTAHLTKEDFQFEGDTCYINKKRQKTGTLYTSVILPDGVEVLKKYNFELPIITNQRTNSYLKEIQVLCNIKKNLHCHLFRKTYATQMLNRGVRIETVSKLLGHSNTRVTQSTYAKLLNNTVIEEVKKIF